MKCQDLVAGVFEKRPGAPEAKEPEVGGVEESHGLVVESTEQDLEPYRPMNNVGKADDNKAVRGQHARYTSEEVLGMEKVFQHVAHQHDFKALLNLTVPTAIVEVRDNHAITNSGGSLCRYRVYFDARHTASHLPQPLREETGGTTEFENPPIGADKLQNQPAAIIAVIPGSAFISRAIRLWICVQNVGIRHGMGSC